MLATRRTNDTYHVFRDLKPYAGASDPTAATPEEHEKHLKAVFAADRRGFTWAVKRPA